MRVKRYFAPHLIHELLRCYASLCFAPVGAKQTSTGCLAPRNSTHIRNPLIFQGKSQGHQSKIDDSPHVCAGQQVRALILQAGTSSDLLTLVSYNQKITVTNNIHQGEDNMIIAFIIWTIVAILFMGIGISAGKTKEPAGFFTFRTWVQSTGTLALSFAWEK